ncbi:MAG: hypothetical protein SWE60_14745 [Thermodesulfobacteriota bacterium]|nr:hypothetical protein [Thermodesulfobacteriota bacterium]
MRNKLIVSLVAIFVLCAGHPAWAAYLDLQADVDPITLNARDIFSIDIYLVGETGDNVVDLSYRFDIGFDSTELALHSVLPLSATEALPTGFIDITPLSFNATANTVEWFDGFSFGSASLSSPIYYGSIEFDVLNPVTDGNDDYWVTYVTGAGITIDGNISQPISVGADVTAVPTPAAFWLLGSGLLGLIGVRRHRKN